MELVRFKTWFTCLAALYLALCCGFQYLPMTPEGKHCPTAPVQVVVHECLKEGSMQCECSEPKLGDKAFVQCRCEEKKHAEDSVGGGYKFQIISIQALHLESTTIVPEVRLIALETPALLAGVRHEIERPPSC